LVDQAIVLDVECIHALVIAGVPNVIHTHAIAIRYVLGAIHPRVFVVDNQDACATA
jgi:hypothetical protein